MKITRAIIIGFIAFISMCGYSQNVYTYVGTGNIGDIGEGGNAVDAEINHPYGICADNAGNIYFADQGNFKIKKIDNLGIITTIVSTNDIPNLIVNTLEYYNNALYFLSYNATNGSTIYRYVLSSSSLDVIYSFPSTQYTNIEVFADTLFLVESVSSVNSEIDLLVNIDIAPTPVDNFSAVGSNQYAYNYDNITDLLILGVGKLVVLQSNGSSGSVLYIDLGNSSSAVTPIPIASNPLVFPEGITKNIFNEMFICDQANNKIYKLWSNGTIVDYAGTGTAGYYDTIVAQSEFNSPTKIAINNLGEFFISDYNNNVIRQITTCTLGDIPIIESTTGLFNICGDQLSYLYVDETQVDLNDNLNWVWYRDACGVNEIVKGDSLEVSSTENGTYYVRAENGCVASGLCAEITVNYTSFCDSVQIDNNTTIYSAFSPNGDGDNDTWIIEGIDSVLQNKVYIYSRWGDIVYYTQDYDNIENVWDGLNQETNEKVSVGTFFYVIESKDTKVASGWVQVIR